MIARLLTNDLIHAAVVVFVVFAAAVLRGAGELDNNTTSIVFGAAIGFAAGRSGSPSRTHDR